MDRGAWWATVHGVAKSQIQLKLLSTHTPPYRLYLQIQPHWGYRCHTETGVMMVMAQFSFIHRSPAGTGCFKEMPLDYGDFEFKFYCPYWYFSWQV